MTGTGAARRAIGEIDRAARTRLLAVLTARFGDLDLAEDALQEALIQALRTWPETGVPASPEAWLTTTAKRKALDVVRRDGVLAAKLAELRIYAEREPRTVADPVDALEPAPVPDERLGLFFACAHPALRPEQRIALTLRFVAGLSTAEVAAALLIPVTTAQQRIVRAKKRIATLGIRFVVPARTELPDRLPVVLRTVYLLFSEGYARSTGAEHVRDDLTAEAIRLARLLRALLPCAETTGLLALLVLTNARRPARTGPDGHPVALADQDRARWDRAGLTEGIALAEEAAGARGASSYAIQAAIAAVHAEAGTAAETDWRQITVLYRMLAVVEPGPVVRLGGAVAEGRAYGPDRGMRRLRALADDPMLSRFRPFHIACAVTLTESGDEQGAAAAYRRALELPGNAAEDDYLAASLAGLETPDGS
ncbi:MAG: sigma-70 family RNA polymerase sigma factor [Gordonia sp. (in: high G+C Gram-positive bacteria)]|uniref:RNA polymerase sigma factor n=1 Tax=Gordonia sp. (in: high G+C Gram-positive bacteria) TaxID=84139 RepID=UPI0039E52551